MKQVPTPGKILPECTPSLGAEGLRWNRMGASSSKAESLADSLSWRPVSIKQIIAMSGIDHIDCCRITV